MLFLASCFKKYVFKMVVLTPGIIFIYRLQNAFQFPKQYILFLSLALDLSQTSLEFFLLLRQCKFTTGNLISVSPIY